MAAPGLAVADRHELVGNAWNMDAAAVMWAVARRVAALPARPVLVPASGAAASAAYAGTRTAPPVWMVGPMDGVTSEKHLEAMYGKGVHMLASREAERGALVAGPAPVGVREAAAPGCGGADARQATAPIVFVPARSGAGGKEAA